MLEERKKSLKEFNFEITLNQRVFEKNCWLKNLCFKKVLCPKEKQSILPIINKIKVFENLLQTISNLNHVFEKRNSNSTDKAIINHQNEVNNLKPKHKKNFMVSTFKSKNLDCPLNQAQNIASCVLPKEIIDVKLAKKIISDAKTWKNVHYLKKSYFNQINFSELRNITTHLQCFSSEDFQDSLYKILLLSRDYKQISLASSNAATILKMTGFLFSCKNLQGIKIPYADLTRGAFIYTNFSNSDLSQTDFLPSLIASSNFTNAKIQKQAPFEKLFLSSSEKISEVIISKCNKYFVTISEPEKLEDEDELYAKNFKIFSMASMAQISNLGLWIQKSYETETKFSLDSNLLFINIRDPSNSEVRVWNFTKNIVEKLNIESLPIASKLLSINEEMLAYYHSDYIFIKQLPSLNLIEKILIFHGSLLDRLIFSACNEYLLWNIVGKISIWSTKSLSLYKTITISAGKPFFLQGNFLVIEKNNYLYQIWNIEKEEPFMQFKASQMSYCNIPTSGKHVLIFSPQKFGLIEIENQRMAILYFRNGNLPNKNNKVMGRIFDSGIVSGCNAVKPLKNLHFTSKLDFNENDAFNSVSINISACGQILVLFSPYYGKIKLWNARTRKWWVDYDVSIFNATNYELSGNLIACIGSEINQSGIMDTIKIIDVKVGNIISTVHTSIDCVKVKVSMCLREICVISRQENFYLFSVDSGRLIQFLEINDGDDDDVKIYFSSFVNDNFIFYTSEESLVIWDRKSSNIQDCKIYKIRSLRNEIIGSYSGKWLAFPNILNNSAIYVFDWKEKNLIKLHYKEDSKNYLYTKICFSTCENYLASTDRNEIIIWDIKKGIQIAKTGKIFEWIEGIIWAPCGKYIISFIHAESIQLWSIDDTIKEYNERVLKEKNENLVVNLKLAWTTANNEDICLI